MIKLYTKKGLTYNELEMFVEMFKYGRTKPGRLMYPFVVKACAELSMSQFGLLVDGLIRSSGVDLSMFVGTRLFVSCSEFRMDFFQMLREDCNCCQRSSEETHAEE